MPSQDSHYYKKGDGSLTIRIRELEDENYQLKDALKKHSQDFKDLLKEIDQQKSTIRDRET